MQSGGGRRCSLVRRPPKPLPMALVATRDRSRRPKRPPFLRPPEAKSHKQRKGCRSKCVMWAPFPRWPFKGTVQGKHSADVGYDAVLFTSPSAGYPLGCRCENRQETNSPHQRRSEEPPEWSSCSTTRNLYPPGRTASSQAIRNNQRRPRPRPRRCSRGGRQRGRCQS